MRGLFLDAGKLSFREDLPEPEAGPDETRVRVLRAGICATDLALSHGYMDFTGVPGHEFVGVALDGPHAGERVVGDINAACGACPACDAGDGHHCPHRTVLGIAGRSGAFAELLSLPTANLLCVPETISDDAATFVEPLAAAFQIGEQVELRPGDSALVVGDGRLGLLCVWALHLAGLDVTVVGRHAERAALLPGSTTFRTGTTLRTTPLGPVSEFFDLVVEASGQAEALSQALASVRPQGTLVLKTTTGVPSELDLSPLVVHEVSIVGSRCGPLPVALDALAAGLVPVEPLIAARYPLRDGVAAFARAGAGGVLKILFDISPA